MADDLRTELLNQLRDSHEALLDGIGQFTVHRTPGRPAATMRNPFTGAPMTMSVPARTRVSFTPSRALLAALEGGTEVEVAGADAVAELLAAYDAPSWTLEALLQRLTRRGRRRGSPRAFEHGPTLFRAFAAEVDDAALASTVHLGDGQPNPDHAYVAGLQGVDMSRYGVVLEDGGGNAWVAALEGDPATAFFVDHEGTSGLDDGITLENLLGAWLFTDELTATLGGRVLGGDSLRAVEARLARWLGPPRAAALYTPPF